jgi:hypothetical protein
MPWLDDSTLSAIEADMSAAHESLAYGDKFDTKGAMKVGIKVLEVTVPAAILSYANARSAAGEVMLGPVPLDLGLGIALSLLAAFDVADEYTEDMLNIGLGALASYATRTGAAFGAAAAKAAPAQATSGLEISGAGGVKRRMHHHVSGAGQLEISGAMLGTPVPQGTQRFVVQEING